jgi:hypothetical protein
VADEVAKEMAERRGKNWGKELIIPNFGLRFFYARGIESTFICRWWNRDMLSLLVPNLGP